MEAAFVAGHELVAGPIDYVRLNSRDVRAWRGADRASTAVVLGFLRAGHGANMGFTRSLFERIDGFDEDFQLGGAGHRVLLASTAGRSDAAHPGGRGVPLHSTCCGPP